MCYFFCYIPQTCIFFSITVIILLPRITGLLKKSRIRETLNLSTDADNSTKTILVELIFYYYFFLVGLVKNFTFVGNTKFCHIPEWRLVQWVYTVQSPSYVKWLEAAGARVVPVLVDTSGGLDQTDYFKEVGRNTSSHLVEILSAPW